MSKQHENHRHTVIWLAVAMAFGCVGAANAQPAAVPASASSTQTKTLHPVVVTANVSINEPKAKIKRQSTAIVDSLTAADVQNLPDDNLSEVMDRIVGVSSDKFTSTSEAGSSTIRGFDARYNSMDIDGNPMWFGSQNNRGAQLAMFPSSIIHQINVYKTVTPDMDANSVGGHLSLRTLRAYDGGPKPYAKLAAKVGHYNQDGKVGGGPYSYKISGAGKMTFGPDNKFGVVVGFDSQRKRDYDTYRGVDGYRQVDGHDQVNGNIYENGDYDKIIKRNAVYAKLEAYATDKMYAFLSANYFNENTQQWLQRNGQYVYNSKTTNFNNGVADFTGGVGQEKEYDYIIGRHALVLGTGLDYAINDDSSVTLRGSVTDYHYNVRLRYPETFQYKGAEGTYDISGHDPVYTLTNDDVGDPAQWVYRNSKASYIQWQPLADKVYSLRAEYKFNTYPGATGLGFRTGMSWWRLDRKYNQVQYNYSFPKGTVMTLADVPGDMSMLGHGPVLTDWNGFWQNVKANADLSVDPAATADYSLREDDLAAYATLYYATDKFHLLAGFREVQTGTDDRTAEINSGVTGPLLWSRTYRNFLPNVQMWFDFTPKLRLRLAYTKTIARPDFGDYASGITIKLDGLGNPVISGTNKDLGPRVSNNYDASLEYYYSKGDYFSLALFRKELSHETFKEKRQEFDADGNVILTETEPFNNGSARVNGLEISWVHPHFGFLPAPFDGFGASANYTRLDGRWNVVLSDGTPRIVDGLRNQPRWLANFRLSYAKGPVQINLDWRARGRTFTGTFATTPPGDHWIAPYKQLDLSAHYKFSKKFMVYASARNLTDEDWSQTTGLDDSVLYSVNPGRSYWLGVQFKYW